MGERMKHPKRLGLAFLAATLVSGAAAAAELERVRPAAFLAIADSQ